MGYADVTEREPEFYWNSNVRKGTSDDYEDDEVNVNDWGGWGIIGGESKQNKKEYFYDENDVAINECEFACKIDYKINIDRVFTSDTAVVGRLYTRKVNGELQREAMEYLRKYLANISGRQLDTAKVIVINYFPGDKNIETGLSHAYLYNKDYTKKLNKITPNEYL